MILDRFACVVLNYNDAQTTIKLVNKIKDYSYIGHVIIVDNNSTDNSIEILLNCKDKNVDLITASRNGGYGAGNNYGIEYATKKLGSRYIIISNPDVCFENNVLKKMMGTFNSDDLCAVVAPVQVDSKGIIIKDCAWKIPSIMQYILTSGLVMEKLFKSNHYPKKFLEDRDLQFVDGWSLVGRP